MIFRLLLLELSNALRRVQKEINPLEMPGPNPVKDVVKTSATAHRTRRAADVSRAREAHSKAISYAKQHGYPRLTKQLEKHKNELPKPRNPVKKKQQLSPKKQIAKPQLRMKDAPRRTGR